MMSCIPVVDEDKYSKNQQNKDKHICTQNKYSGFKQKQTPAKQRYLCKMH